MAGTKTTQYDIDGSTVLSEVLLVLVNQFPGLKTGEKIAFATLADNKGKALFPSTGAIIETDERDILGGHHQVCRYPFTIVLRSGSLTEARRVTAKEWLDDLGRWLEKQTISVDSTDYTLEEYPDLGAGRVLTSIRRTSPSYLNAVYDNKVEDWAITISARYKNDF